MYKTIKGIICDNDHDRCWQCLKGTPTQGLRKWYRVAQKKNPTNWEYYAHRNHPECSKKHSGQLPPGYYDSWEYSFIWEPLEPISEVKIKVEEYEL